MSSCTPLQQLSRTAANGESNTSILTSLTRHLFDPPNLKYWMDLPQAMKGLIDESLPPKQFERLKGLIETTSDALIEGEGLEDEELYHHLVAAEAAIDADRNLFCPSDQSEESSLSCLTYFTPMVLIHLSVLELIHLLAHSWSPEEAIEKAENLRQTTRRYLAFGQHAVTLAVRWRTRQLEISCTPMEQSQIMYGGPNLHLLLVDHLYDEVIVDERCAAYPGTSNPTLQRAVDRINHYEERLHFRALLFWESQVFAVLSEWSGEMNFETPAPPKTMDEKLDDALYMVMQNLAGSMMGLS